MLGTILFAIIIVFLLSLYFSPPFSRWFFAIVWAKNPIILRLKKLFDEHRKEWLKDFSKLDSNLTILEVGIGDGANFALYPKNSQLIAVDLNDNFEKDFRKNIKDFPHINLLKYVTADIQDMRTIDNNSVDVVLLTHVLCSVPNVPKALQEVKRVLKPKGKFFFFEHVAYKDQTSLSVCARALAQTLITPLWKLMMGGCHPSNTNWEHVLGAGFSDVHLEHVYPSNLPFVFKPHIIGFAVK